MISYPGDIHARFGRYEAVEELGPQGRGQLWRAWDPFLERFVLIASVPGLDPAELHRGVAALDDALRRWLGPWSDGDRFVLDFAPGGEGIPAFFVFEAGELGSPATTTRRPGRHGARRSLIAGLIVGVLLLLGVVLWLSTEPATVGEPRQPRSALTPLR